MTNDKETTIPQPHPYDYEQASNAYLMSVVAVTAGLPLPIINVVASLIFFLAKRKASYFVRWHALQGVLAQLVVMPFNSVAFAWTLSVILQRHPFGSWNLPHRYYTNSVSYNDFSSVTASALYWAYIIFVVVLNIIEFIAVISTAIQVRKGKNVRWFIIANITDALCSKKNRDPFVI